MILDIFYKFDWKLQPLGTRSEFLQDNFGITEKYTIYQLMSFLLHRIFYLWGRSSFIFNEQTDKPMNNVLDYGYYVNLTSDQKASLYFVNSLKDWGYCFDKELLKLFWSDYAVSKDDSFNQTNVLTSIYSKMFWVWNTFVKPEVMEQYWIDLSTEESRDEIKALLWLWILNLTIAQMRDIWPKINSACNWLTNLSKGIWNIYDNNSKGGSLLLFYEKYWVWNQISTFFNPDFALFDKFMITFLKRYKINEWLWGVYQAKLFETLNFHNALLETWEVAVNKKLIENENTYWFFYLLNQFMTWPQTTTWDNLFVNKKSHLWLYNELKKREAWLMENFSTQESVFAFMSIEFVTYLFYIIRFHNAFLSWKDKTEYNTYGKLFFIVSDWLDNVSRYSNLEWLSDKNKEIQLIPRDKLPFKTFFNNINSTPVNDITREEFNKHNNQIYTIAVSRIKKWEWKEDLDPVDWYPFLITFYSKNKYNLDNTVAGRQKITPSLAKLMMDSNQDTKKKIKAQIEWADSQDWDIPDNQNELIEQEISEDINNQLINKQSAEKENLISLEKEAFDSLFTVDELYNELRKHIFWQDAILKHISRKIYAYLVLKKENNKPLTFFLVWPPGTWKTYLSEVLVKVLNKFIPNESAKFNAQSEIATNYSDKASLTKLLWASASFVWHGDKINFFEELMKKKNQIILFDEIEKWDPALYPFFLEFINNGKLESNDGKYGVYMWNTKDISFLPKWEQINNLSNVILIFASNAITSVKQVQELSWEEFDHEIDTDLFQKGFISWNRTLRNALRNWRNGNKSMDNAFLDRLQLIYLFNPLSEKDLNNIVLNKFNKIIKEFKISKDICNEIEEDFKAEFMSKEVLSTMKDASSMREVQAIIEDWIIQKIEEM